LSSPDPQPDWGSFVVRLASPFRNFFHAGYVVRDMQKVMDAMRDTFGVGRWKVLPLPEGAPARALGFAYAGESMIELVEVDPAGELLPIHRGWTPQAAAEAKLNHLAYMLDSEDELFAVQARFEAKGVRTAWREPFGEIFSQYYYADTTAQLGHYTEFVCLGPAGRDFLTSIPRNHGADWPS
jgi:hypothetical protein